MEMLKMTNNEYRNFLKVNANRIWTEENYTYKQYCEDADKVEIIPFELSKYNLSTDIENLINLYFTEESINKDGEYTLKGFTDGEDQWYRITDKLNLKREMGYYYSGYCHNDNFNFYMTYCEGDLYLKLFENKEDYKNSLEKTIKWYEEN